MKYGVHPKIMKTTFTSASTTTAIAAAALALGLSAQTMGALIGHWTFNEGSGSTAFDSSSGGNNGTIAGGASYVSTPGAFGISLNGSSQFVEIPASPLWNPQGSDFSIIAWLSVSNGGGPIGNDKMIIGVPDRVWSLGMWKPDAKFWTLGDLTSSDPGTPLAGTADGAISDGVQYMTGFSKSTSQQISFWLDGVQVDDGGGAAPFEDAGSQVVHIGECCGGNYLEAVIDEIRIYDHYLFQTEIDAIYAAGPTGIPTIEVTQMTFPNTVSVCITGELGNVYTLQAAENAEGPYGDLGAPIVGTGANLYFFDTSAAGSDTRFYRVQTQP